MWGGPGPWQDSPYSRITPALPPDPVELQPPPPPSSSGCDQAGGLRWRASLGKARDTGDGGSETQAQGLHLSHHLPIPPNVSSRNLKAPLVLAT